MLKGRGSVGNDHVIGAAYADHCKALPIREYDPDKAKFHLNKSGISSAVVQTADVSTAATDLCLVLQAEAAKVGFDLQVQKVAGDGYWGTTWMNTPLHITGWNMRPTANVMMSLMYHSGATWNETMWKDERFDKLLVDVRGVTDPGLREEMYCEMQTMIHNDAGTILSLHRQLRGRHQEYGEGPPAGAAGRGRRLRVAGVRLARRVAHPLPALAATAGAGALPPDSNARRARGAFDAPRMMNRRGPVPAHLPVRSNSLTSISESFLCCSRR